MATNPRRYAGYLVVSVMMLAGCSGEAIDPNDQVPPDILAGVIDSLGVTIAAQYVIRDQANRLVEHLESRHTEGGYRDLKPQELADVLTSDLREWSGDKHFLVWHTGTLPPIQNNAIAAESVPNPEQPQFRLLSGNIAFLHGIRKISLRDTRRFEQALVRVSGADGLIIDLRECFGGDRDAVRLVASYFFEPPFLLQIEEEVGKPAAEIWAHDRIEGKRLLTMPVIVLTSKRTASGGESLAYLLQQHGRAKMVGEKTFGAAHAVKTFDLSDGFRAFIPRVRPIHPKTRTNWEGTGVKPDLAVAAEEALEVGVAQVLNQ